MSWLIFQALASGARPEGKTDEQFRRLQAPGQESPRADSDEAARP
jgi:hypothetical protein